MSQETCIQCRKPETVSACGVCAGKLCKKCRVFLAEGSFPFRSDSPPELKHTYYCGAWWGYGFHEDGVASALAVCRQLGVAAPG